MSTQFVKRYLAIVATDLSAAKAATPPSLIEIGKLKGQQNLTKYLHLCTVSKAETDERDLPRRKRRCFPLRERERMETAWNSIPLEITYEMLGWLAFFSWSISFYPQVVLNFRRKSVVGLNFDFVVLNLTKHSSYLIYNATLYFSSAVQRQYREKYGLDEMIPVAANDVAFSIHAVLLTSFTLFQIFIYERGNQKFSKISLTIVSAAWLAGAVCLVIALPSHSWLWLISVFNIIQVIMTVIKYIPQAFMNFYRKSTEGFSIGNILLDFLGGSANYGQMTVQSIDQNSWVNFYGNIGKTLLSLVSMSFDILFICQHYVLYGGGGKKAASPATKLDEEAKEPLIESSDQAGSGNV